MARCFRGISGFGDTLWRNVELHLGCGRPLSLAVDPSALYSLLLSLFFSAFSPFFPCRLGFAAGEAGSFAPGEALCLKSQEIHALGDGPRQPEPAFFLCKWPQKELALIVSLI